MRFLILSFFLASVAFASSGYYTGGGTAAITCSANQFVSAISAAGAPTCGGLSGGGSGNITDINADVTAVQTLTLGTTGSDLNWVDNGSGDHKLHVPDAGATARGVVTTGTQTFAGAKTFSTPLGAASGGTGVANNAAATFTRSGNHALTITTTGTTGVTFPTSGTLATTAGNVATATALAANPAACSAGTFVNDTNANGDLTCANPFTGMVEDFSGHIETASNKTYYVIPYAALGRKIVNVRLACGTSGTITAALKVDGSNITTCNGISVTSTPGTTTCDTGATSTLATNSILTLVTTSNSSCLDLYFDIKTTRQ